MVGETEGDGQEKENFRFPENRVESQTPAAVDYSKDVKSLQAERRQVMFQSADWVRVDGSQTDFIPDSKPTAVKEPMDIPRMTWNRSGNVIAAVDESGKMFITPASEDLRSQLSEAGFTHDERLGVPFSHNEKPVHPDAAARWQSAIDSRNRQAAGKEKTDIVA